MKPEPYSAPTSEPQDRFEQELRMALRRVDPAAGFCDRVLARAEPLPVPRAWPAGRRLVYALAAVLLLVFSLAAGLRYRTIAREQRAAREFDQALAITDHALDHTRAQLARAGIRLAPQPNKP